MEGSRDPSIAPGQTPLYFIGRFSAELPIRRSSLSVSTAATAGLTSQRLGVAFGPLVRRRARGLRRRICLSHLTYIVIAKLDIAAI